MASLKGMTEEEKRLRKRKQLNEAQKRYYQKHKEYYKNYGKNFYKNKYEDLKEKIDKAIEYIKNGKAMIEADKDYDVSYAYLVNAEEILNILQEGGE